MKSKFITLLFCTLVIGVSGFSQSYNPLKNTDKMVFFSMADTISKSKIIVAPQMLVSPFFYSSNLAFFCRQEIKFEKITKIPFKFRLGSVQQVDYLEGKGLHRP